LLNAENFKIHVEKVWVIIDSTAAEAGSNCVHGTSLPYKVVQHSSVQHVMMGPQCKDHSTMFHFICLNSREVNASIVAVTVTTLV